MHLPGEHVWELALTVTAGFLDAIRAYIIGHARVTLGAIRTVVSLRVFGSGGGIPDLRGLVSGKNEGPEDIRLQLIAGEVQADVAAYLGTPSTAVVAIRTLKLASDLVLGLVALKVTPVVGLVRAAVALVVEL